MILASSQSRNLAPLLAVGATVVVSFQLHLAVRGAESEPGAEAAIDLPQAEAQLADKFERLEVLAERLAELSRSTQPRRASLLSDLVARSRERDLPGRFQEVVRSLQQESYSSALSGQAELNGELEKLLELLLQEDRDRQLESQRKRLRRYLQDVNRLIRLERGVKARTEGGDEMPQLADDQHRITGEAAKLGRQIDEEEGVTEAKARRKAESEAKKNKEAHGGKQKDARDNSQGDDQRGEKSSEDGAEGSKSSGKSQKSSPGGDNQKRERPTPESQGSEGPPSSDKNAPAEQPNSGGEPGQQGQQGQSGQSSSDQGQAGDEQEQSSPMERTADRLQAAQQRMEEVRRQLKEAERRGATEQQQRAIEELEQARAELERILRQLREEELERTLVLLEARFRKMLDMQIEVYDETKRLDTAAAKAPQHEMELAGSRLSRREMLIVRECDRALVLLREDGTSVAFPESVEQAREDMEQISTRLADVRFEMITQGLEEDVISALEEMLAALQQAIKELRQQRSQQQQAGGAPGEQPLVDQLAELRMIRALQVRVNRRTQQYGALITGEQASEPDLMEALGGLSIRQQKILQATKDLNSKANQ